jgi:hypothetical protein
MARTLFLSSLELRVDGWLAGGKVARRQAQQLFGLPGFWTLLPTASRYRCRVGEKGAF